MRENQFLLWTESSKFLIQENHPDNRLLDFQATPALTFHDVKYPGVFMRLDLTWNQCDYLSGNKFYAVSV